MCLEWVIFSEMIFAKVLTCVTLLPAGPVVQCILTLPLSMADCQTGLAQFIPLPSHTVLETSITRKSASCALAYTLHVAENSNQRKTYFCHWLTLHMLLPHTQVHTNPASFSLDIYKKVAV
jgi:hypothetical protein